jgi:hypothetical protein
LASLICAPIFFPPVLALGFELERASGVEASHDRRSHCRQGRTSLDPSRELFDGSTRPRPGDGGDGDGEEDD